jgi:hypothetical protein
MRNRCLNPQDKDYRNYGGLGVTIWPEWQTSFKTFLKDVGPKPARDRLLWLGRIDLQGNYAPGNVAWLKHQRQISHRRYCHPMPAWQGLTIGEKAREIGMSPSTLRYRLMKQGVELNRAMSPAPLSYRNNSKFLTYQGRTLSLPEWAKLVGIPSKKLQQRLRLGVPPERALMPCDLRKPDSSRYAIP